MTELTIGEHLQNWCLREKVDVTSPMFPGAVDLAIRNALRDQEPNKRCTTIAVSSGSTSSSASARVVAN